MARPVIVAENLGIRFHANRRRRLKAREFLIRGKSGVKDDQFWALQGVSFKINEGESVGVVGGNGHGKSTLLRLIAGVMIPDEGRVLVNGAVAPMIEVTGGFENDLTVRDNISLAAGLKGLSKKQIAERFDDIVAWAEIGHRLDTPFRHLSSGMKAKVGFSVITTVDRPIVLVDEVLAVGDRAFQRKCFLRVEELLGQGRTVVMVSHNPEHIERFCKRGLYLRNGKLIGDDSAVKILAQYAEDADRLAEEDKSAISARKAAEARRAREAMAEAQEESDDVASGAPRRAPR